MARAWREVAHATVHDEADIEAWSATEDLTCRLVRAVIAGCNTSRHSMPASMRRRSSLRDNPTIDVGLAIDSPEGLFVPVLRDVAGATPPDWRRKIEAFKRGVQERSLTPADLRASDDNAVEFRFNRRPPRIPDRHAAAGGDLRRRTDCGAAGPDRRWIHRAAPRLAAIADVRSPRRHWRHGGSLPARRHCGSHGRVLLGADSMEDMFRFADEFGPTRIIHIYRPSLALKAIVVVDNTACGAAIGGVRMAPDVSVE